MPSSLWVCHACEMIGTEAEATAHRVARGHEIEKLDETTTQAVLEEQARLRAERAVGFIQHARLQR